MCLILFAHKTHPDYPLIVAANRDEAYARATAPAGFWQDFPMIYGGRDLELLGTWLGVTRHGKFAAVTNFRDGRSVKDALRSRGELVANYLRGNLPARNYVSDVSGDAQAYNGFNLIAGDLDELHYITNRSHRNEVIAPGIHGLSNDLLDVPWPKVERGKAVVAGLLRQPPQEMIDGLFALLADRATAADETLPDTGVGLLRERVLSPAFIVSPTYGTRSSTVVLVDNHGQVIFIERSFDEYGNPGKAVTGRFTLETVHASA